MSEFGSDSVFSLRNQADLEGIVKQLKENLVHSLILLTGDLGAGKTTLVKAILQSFNSDDKGSSPSFSLINEYKVGSEQFYHIDLYRLNEPEEAFQLGIEDYMYSGAYCFIEWPQLIMEYIHPPYHKINIEVDENGGRQIILSTIHEV